MQIKLHLNASGILSLIVILLTIACIPVGYNWMDSKGYLIMRLIVIGLFVVSGILFKDNDNLHRGLFLLALLFTVSVAQTLF